MEMMRWEEGRGRENNKSWRKAVVQSHTESHGEEAHDARWGKAGRGGDGGVSRITPRPKCVPGRRTRILVRQQCLPTWKGRGRDGPGERRWRSSWTSVMRTSEAMPRLFWWSSKKRGRASPRRRSGVDENGQESLREDVREEYEACAKQVRSREQKVSRRAEGRVRVAGRSVASKSEVEDD